MLGVMQYLLVLGLGVALAIVAARVVFRIRVAPNRINNSSLPPAQVGPLAQALARNVKADGGSANLGKTGIATLHTGEDAFAARMILADAAVSSIDAQYYIWRGDLTGYLLLDALLRAANRGVRVRLLLDDNGTMGLDLALAALNTHPNIEVRLYNPFNLRRLKLLSYTFDFFRLNRRMHNKSFTVDGLVSILGGRNVGDEYFGIGKAALFVDLDMIAMGAAVPDLSADFDRYWAAPPVHLAGPILGAPNDMNAVSKALETYRGTQRFADYRDVLETTELVTALAAGTFGLEWTKAVLISDDPIKGEGAVPRQDLLATRLMQAVGKIKSKLDGISPYLVPGKAGVKAFETLISRGVAVRMLTNSIGATDVVAVHAGYAKRRKAMLRCGVGLFELHALGRSKSPRAKTGPFGSSGSSLHAKVFAVDGARIFVGSFNFDPRSTTLNTEMGLLIESTALADGVHSAFDQGLTGSAWRVALEGNVLVWR